MLSSIQASAQLIRREDEAEGVGDGGGNNWVRVSGETTSSFSRAGQVSRNACRYGQRAVVVVVGGGGRKNARDRKLKNLKKRRKNTKTRNRLEEGTGYIS